MSAYLSLEIYCHILVDTDLDMAPCPYIITHMDPDMSPCLHIIVMWIWI